MLAELFVANTNAIPATARLSFGGTRLRCRAHKGLDVNCACGGSERHPISSSLVCEECASETHARAGSRQATHGPMLFKRRAPLPLKALSERNLEPRIQEEKRDALAAGRRNSGYGTVQRPTIGLSKARGYQSWERSNCAAAACRLGTAPGPRRPWLNRTESWDTRMVTHRIGIA